MKSIKVLPPGTAVTIGADINAVVNSISIGSGKQVSYECIWWNGRTRCSEWLQPHEITTSDVLAQSQHLGIGFTNGYLDLRTRAN